MWGIKMRFPLFTPLDISTSTTLWPSVKTIILVPLWRPYPGPALRFCSNITGAPTFSVMAWGGMPEWQNWGNQLDMCWPYLHQQHCQQTDKFYLLQETCHDYFIDLSTLSFRGVSIALWETKYLSIYPFSSSGEKPCLLIHLLSQPKYSCGILTISSPISGCTGVVPLPSCSKYLQNQLHQVSASYWLSRSVAEFPPREKKNVCRLGQFYIDYYGKQQAGSDVDPLQKPQ